MYGDVVRRWSYSEEYSEHCVPIAAETRRALSATESACTRVIAEFISFFNRFVLYRVHEILFLMRVDPYRQENKTFTVH